MNIVAFIFARGGSKGLPGKNVRPFCGKPLIAWSIEQALSIERVSRVVVSTDSDNIARISRSYGAETPFIRPSHLATDDSPEWLSWRHALEQLRCLNILPDVMLSLPATAPLRDASDINACIDKFLTGYFDAVVSVTDAHRNPFFNMVKSNPDNSVELVISNHNAIRRRQDSPVVFDMTTVAYAFNPHFIMNNNYLFDGKVGSVHVPLHRSIDIDTLYDFQIAEFLMNQRSQ